MGFRQFWRAFRATKGQSRPASPEDHLADDVRETMGPLAGGGGGGHMTGESVYHYIEDHEQQPHRPDDD